MKKYLVWKQKVEKNLPIQGTFSFHHSYKNKQHPQNKTWGLVLVRATILLLLLAITGPHKLKIEVSFKPEKLHLNMLHAACQGKLIHNLWSQ